MFGLLFSLFGGYPFDSAQAGSRGSFKRNTRLGSRLFGKTF